MSHFWKSISMISKEKYRVPDLRAVKHHLNEWDIGQSVNAALGYFLKLNSYVFDTSSALFSRIFYPEFQKKKFCWEKLLTQTQPEANILLEPDPLPNLFGAMSRPYFEVENFKFETLTHCDIILQFVDEVSLFSYTYVNKFSVDLLL